MKPNAFQQSLNAVANLKKLPPFTLALSPEGLAFDSLASLNKAWQQCTDSTAVQVQFPEGGSSIGGLMNVSKAEGRLQMDISVSVKDFQKRLDEEVAANRRLEDRSGSGGLRHT